MFKVLENSNVLNFRFIITINISGVTKTAQAALTAPAPN